MRNFLFSSLIVNLELEDLEVSDSLLTDNKLKLMPLSKLWMIKNLCVKNSSYFLFSSYLNVKRCSNLFIKRYIADWLSDLRLNCAGQNSCSSQPSSLEWIITQTLFSRHSVLGFLTLISFLLSSSLTNTSYSTHFRYSWLGFDFASLLAFRSLVFNWFQLTITFFDCVSAGVSLL